MRSVVPRRWLEYTEPLEGGVACFYNDIRGLTTVAYGNLCNSPGEAASLQMVWPDGRIATTADKIAAWTTVHDDPLCAKRGWKYAATLTPLRLTRAGMEEVALRKLAQNDAVLHKRLPEWETYPACAQFGFHSLAWACGAGAHFPKLFSAAQARDWDACSVEIHMNEWTPEGIRNAGLVPRNVANKILMRNASFVDRYHLDPDYLDWTTPLGPCKVHSDCADCADLGFACTMSSMQAADTRPDMHAASSPTVYPRPVETLYGVYVDGPIIHPWPDTVTEAQRRDDDE